MGALMNVTNLGKRYDGFHLEDIGLAAEAGTVVGLIRIDGQRERPPRSRCCSSILQPDEGEGGVLGCPIREGHVFGRERQGAYRRCS